MWIYKNNCNPNNTLALLYSALVSRVLVHIYKSKPFLHLTITAAKWQQHSQNPVATYFISSASEWQLWHLTVRQKKRMALFGLNRWTMHTPNFTLSPIYARAKTASRIDRFLCLCDMAMFMRSRECTGAQISGMWKLKFVHWILSLQFCFKLEIVIRKTRLQKAIDLDCGVLKKPCHGSVHKDLHSNFTIFIFISLSFESGVHYCQKNVAQLKVKGALLPFSSKSLLALLFKVSHFCRALLCSAQLLKRMMEEMSNMIA